MKTILTTTAVIVAMGSVPALATTITPGDYSQVFTESDRVSTVDGADVSGNELLAGNADVATETLPALTENNSFLVSGVVSDGSDALDRFELQNVTGSLELSLLNLAGSLSAPRGSFAAGVDVFVNGTSVQSVFLGGSSGSLLTANIATISLFNDDVAIEVSALIGASDYDLSMNLTQVPLPANAVLLMAGLFGLRGLRKRQKA